MKTDDFLRVVELIAKRYRGHVEQKENRIILCCGEREYSDEISDINDILVKISSMTKSEVAMFNDREYEIALDRTVGNYFERNNEPIEDCENQIKYTVGTASMEYLVWMLCSLDDRTLRGLRDLNASTSSSFMHRYEFREGDESLLWFIGDIFRRVVTLKIQSCSPKSEIQFKQFLDSFRFQVASNYNRVIMPIEAFEDMCITIVGRISSRSSNDMTAPKRTYIKELTNQYYMGLSSKLPFVQFICYYHVMEYFFEKVYNDDMIKSLQDQISSPRFSVKREHDIKEIIKFVTKKVRDKNERYDINELEALELVLKKYVNIEDIKGSLPDRVIDYYATSEVPFSKGDVVDFNNLQSNNLYEKLAKRIYKTRNSIIHSKSGEKAVYSPFKDDKALEKEIPLLKFVAEEIIIQTSSLMR